MSAIPNEILTLVQDFKNFVKTQKALREENYSQRFSMAPILQIENELENNIKSNLHKIDLELQQKNKVVESLKLNTSNLLKDAELAHRLLKTEIPFSLSSFTISENQVANPSAKKYFVGVVEQFEKQMETYSKHIKDLELHLNNLNKPYTPDELIMMVKKQHEALIALAAEVYLVHEEIAKLKRRNDKNNSTELQNKFKN